MPGHLRERGLDAAAPGRPWVGVALLVLVGVGAALVRRFRRRH
ncbi:hypothetical protein [Sorangium cellulosum]|nr:hypothetical protein [Sorangium cellulosum]